MCSLLIFLLNMFVEALNSYKYQNACKTTFVYEVSIVNFPESTFGSLKNERWFLVSVCHMTIVILHSVSTQNLNFSS